MSKFIEKAIEMQECCLRGNVKRNPEARKETAERNFSQSCTICCLTGKRIEGGCVGCPINGCREEVIAALDDSIEENKTK